MTSEMHIFEEKKPGAARQGGGPGHLYVLGGCFVQMPSAQGDGA